MIHVGRCLIKRCEVSLHCYGLFCLKQTTPTAVLAVYRCFKIGCTALGDRDGFSRTLEKRLASRYFSSRRVTKATTVRASTSSTSHITIVGLNIVDPFRPLMPTPDFLNSYLRHRCLPLMDTCVTSVLFRLSPIQPTKGLACRSARYSVRQMNTFDWTSINLFKLDFIPACRLTTNSRTDDRCARKCGINGRVPWS